MSVVRPTGGGRPSSNRRRGRVEILFPDQTCPRRNASRVVACALGLTKSYLTTLASALPGPAPLTKRLAPVVVLVVATRVPPGPPNGSKLAISRNWAP